MVAPYAAVYERDESGYINTEQSINVFIASEAPCGPVGTRLIPNSKTFYKKYTPDGAYKSGYPVAFLNAQAVFDINSPIYFTRVVPEDALYGGAVVTIGNQVPSYSLLAGLSSPDAFVFADEVNSTYENISDTDGVEAPIEDIQTPDVAETLIVPRGERRFAINPLNWKTDATPADRTQNKGAVFVTNDLEVTEVAQFCGAYLDTDRGVLKVPDVDPAEYSMRPDVLPEGSFHIYDLYFFWNNLKENVGVRLAAYQSRHQG